MNRFKGTFWYFTICISLIVGLFIIRPYVVEPTVGDTSKEFRGTQGTTAASYPSTGVLTKRAIEYCFANDDDADSIFLRWDGGVADSAEANCDTAGCLTEEIKFGEKVCRNVDSNKFSLDAAGNGAAFRLRVYMR